jgi:hypothetical protein
MALAQAPAVRELKATPVTVHRNFFDEWIRQAGKLDWTYIGRQRLIVAQ